MLTRTSLLWLVAGLLLAVATASICACGGSSGGGSGPVMISAPSEAALDGWVTSSGGVNVSSGGPAMGDLDHIDPGVGFRQIFSFDITGIPGTATIVGATLQLYQTNLTGDPYSNHGTVVVDHVAYGASPTGVDYGNPALSPGLGPLSTDGAEEYKTLDVTAQVQNDVNAPRMHSQFRLRFSIVDSDNDGVGDYVSFVESEDSCCATGQLPQLVITYIAP